MKTAILITAILRMMGFGPLHTRTCEHTKRAQQVAFEIPRAIRAERSHQRATLLAAVAGAESSWRWTRRGDVIRGKDGEVGWYQIHPEGRGETACQDLDIGRPEGNTRCAVRLLDIARRECGPEPVDFLGRYNGIRACGPSEYARQVLAIEAKATSRLVAEVP
jgi:hypothetical protein